MRSPARRTLAALVLVALVLALVPATGVAAPQQTTAEQPARRAPKTAAVPSAVIVRFADGTASQADVYALASEGVEPEGAERQANGRARLRVRNGQDASDVARKLEKRSGVVWAVPDVPVYASALPVPPNDTYYGSPLGYTKPQRSYLGALSAENPYSIDLEPAWRQAFASAERGMDLNRAGVTLALVDTGYTPTKETPAGAFVPKRDYVGDDNDTTDDEGHGTTVGNLMRAATGNGTGIAGVQYATPSKVLVYKVLGANGSGSLSDVITAVEAAADAGAKVINCSLGASGLDNAGRPLPGMQAAWDDTLAYVTARGAVVVAAAGNENAPVDFPAAAKGAIAVGAIDPSTGARSSFSNYGPQLALTAPGQRILVATKDGTTISGAGTSYASPIVAASVGLLWSLLPKAPATSITSAFMATARDFGAAGPDDYYGAGEIDVWAAYQRLMATYPTQAPMSVSVSGTPGFTTTLKWTPAGGSDVVYRYGVVGGASYTTTRTTGDVYVGADGTYDVWVRASATDMFSNAPATLGFTVFTGKPGLVLKRHAGADRYATAVAVSRSAFPTSAPSVVIASGERFPDALSASVLAYRSGAPLLLTRAGYLPQSTAEEIARLKPASAVIVGGGSSVGGAVRDSVAGLVPSVTRIAGADRYETAERVAYAVRELEGGARLASGTVVVASGERFPDALAASPMAAAAGYPILLTRRDYVPEATSRALTALGVTHTVLVGGPPTVSDDAARSLPSATRIAGRDRYETSRRIADAAVDGILSRERIGLATGRGFPDALSGGVLMARLGGPLVLGDGTDADLEAWLGGIGEQCREVDVFGSETSVPAPFATRVLTVLRAP